MNAKLLSCEDHQFHEALALYHVVLRADLIRAATQPGRLGQATKHVARLCWPHRP